MGGAGYLTKGRGGLSGRKTSKRIPAFGAHERFAEGAGQRGVRQGPGHFVGPENLASKVPLSVRAVAFAGFRAAPLVILGFRMIAVVGAWRMPRAQRGGRGTLWRLFLGPARSHSGLDWNCSVETIQAVGFGG